jgi:hypothetical protein
VADVGRIWIVQQNTDHHTALDDRERTLSQDRGTEKNQVHAGEPLAGGAKRQEASEAGVHPIVIKTAMRFGSSPQFGSPFPGPRSATFS